jgi:hypothetical protein
MTDDRERREESRNDPPSDDPPTAERPSDELPNADPPSERDARDPPEGGDRRDRRGEPLGDLAAEVRARTGGKRSERPTEGERGRPTEEGGERPAEQRPTDDRPRRERDGPLGDLAAEVDERRRRRDDGDAFESVEVGDLDGERLWEEVAERDNPSESVSPGEASTADVSAETVSTPETASAADASSGTPSTAEAASLDGTLADDRDLRTIPKNTCHGCPNFADPPELACTHEGTEIAAMVDADHFRVVDCPMVDDEEDIGTIEVESDDAAE